MPNSPRFLPVLLTAALVAGCNEYEINNFETTDIFNQNPWEKVDVLLVVDNSCSMEPYQVKLGEDFGGFFEFFAEGEVDWQLAVTHTDVLAEDFGRIRGPIVTPASSDPQALFTEVVNVGAEGRGIEMGLEAAKQAITGRNPGFPREDATISVIFVSDEQDTSPGPVAQYVDDYYSVRGHRSRDAFNASALTVISMADCDPEQFLSSTQGTRYVEAADLSGGVIANLCEEDLSPIVTDLALTTSAMRDTFYLSRRPNPDTLEVSVEDEFVSCADGIWTYALMDEGTTQRSAIIFDAEHIPRAGERIVVKYTNGTGRPDGLCADDDTAAEPEVSR